jgi:hypothetical protein
MEEMNKPIALERSNVERMEYEGTAIVTYREPGAVEFQGRQVPAYNTIGGLNIRVARYIGTVYKPYGHIPRKTEADFNVGGKVISGEYLNKMINNTRVYAMVAHNEGISYENEFYAYMEKNLYDFCHYKGKYFDQAMALLDKMSIGGKIGEMIGKDFFRAMVAQRGMIGTIAEPTLEQDSAGIDGFFRWMSKDVEKEVTLQVKSFTETSPDLKLLKAGFESMKKTEGAYKSISKLGDAASDKQKAYLEVLQKNRGASASAKTKGMISLNIKGTDGLIDYLILYKIRYRISDMDIEQAMSVYNAIYDATDVIILRVGEKKGEETVQKVTWESEPEKVFVFPMSSIVAMKVKI